ncbi:MAG: DUF5107 domain-containing protein [Anaerolineae bacterium]
MPSPTPLPPPTSTAATASAQVSIEVEPRGARVLIDGLRSGSTPVSLQLPAGQHTVRVEMEGYEPLEETITIAANDQATISGQLVPQAGSEGAPHTPTATLQAAEPSPLPDLAFRSVKIELETAADCGYDDTALGLAIVIENKGEADAGPFVVEALGERQTVDGGLAAGQEVRIWFQGYGYLQENPVLLDATSAIDESDEDNNSFSEMLPIPTLPPTCTPPPAAASTPEPTVTLAPTPSVAVTLREGEITIPTYPYAEFTTEAWNETFNMPYAVLDWAAYNAADPSPIDTTYRTLEVENQYLILTFLPDLGGRLYEVYFKPTGHHQTYRNPVLKPSPWGPPEMGWWLAAGGIEWCLPVEEHGYEWGIPWNISATQDGQRAIVTLRDTGASVQDRVRATISIQLAAGTSSFTIQTQLENPTAAPLPVKYWHNAMLAPGGQNAPTADLHFVLPEAVTEMTVHSRGDDRLPGPNQQITWPMFQDTDLSRLGNWTGWLGLFENPAQGNFVAVYDQGYDEGMVRIFPSEIAQGTKIFAAGWSDSLAPEIWTDNDSSYVELHGGPAPTFADSVTLPAGGDLSWSETWYPVAGLGGLRFANETAALHLATDGRQVQLGATATQRWTGDVVLLLDQQEIFRQRVLLVPGDAFRETVALDGEEPGPASLTLRLENQNGESVAEYGTGIEVQG